MTLQNRINILEKLLKTLDKATLAEKQTILSEQIEVKNFLKQEHYLAKLLATKNPKEDFAIKSVLAIGQGPILFNALEKIKMAPDLLNSLLKVLLDVENSYNVIGGIIGYHLNVLKRIVEMQQPSLSIPENILYHKPEGMHLFQNTKEVRHLIRWGIHAMGQIAEMYPVGGAGDRLNLKNETTGEALPAAELKFNGKSLLEGLIRDLQGREYLYYKIHGKQINVPIAMMTSNEKNNHHHITRICDENHWFGRPKDRFYLFIQPLVPVVTIQGDWVIQAPLQLMLKPGGHGVIWKLAFDNNIFNNFTASQCNHALIRQINNPVAGTDFGLLAFIGFGHHYKKSFGFASCPRRLNASEGMDVLVETDNDEKAEYRISNIEYTDFKKHGIEDIPESSDSPYSVFPANTNILFANLPEIESLLPICPIPGMLINMKNTVTFFDSKGKVEEIPAGRLESTMQNISDYIIDSYPTKLSQITPTSLSSFVTYNERRKTISVTKKTYHTGESISETPEGCLYEILHNHFELFTEHCKMELPPIGSEEEYLKNGPPFHILFHPALGPIYSVIAQKIRNGKIAWGSEMQLEIAELEIIDLNLTGSLLITAESVIGRAQGDQILYSEDTGKCILRHVTIENQGIDREVTQDYWKNQISRHACLEIVLKGNGEFFAENVIFRGSHKIDVPDGHRMMAEMDGKDLIFHLEKIATPSWHWSYTFDEDDNIRLAFPKIPL